VKSIGVKKLYYTISEVSRITELEQYVLRYWEAEFAQLKPEKNRAGNRIYTNGDVKLILEIKRLLREQRYTIEGAKKILEGWIKPEEEFPNEEEMLHNDIKQKSDLKEVKIFLEELLIKLS